MSARVRVMLYGMKSSVLPAHSITDWLRRDGSWSRGGGVAWGAADGDAGVVGGAPAEPQQRAVARRRRRGLRHVDQVALQLPGQVGGTALPAGPAEGQPGPVVLTRRALRKPVLL